MSGQVAKLVTAGCFGIALLGLYFIFNSPGTQMSLAACAMYIAGIPPTALAVACGLLWGF